MTIPSTGSAHRSGRILYDTQLGAHRNTPRGGDLPMAVVRVCSRVWRSCSGARTPARLNAGRLGVSFRLDEQPKQVQEPGGADR